MMTTKTLRPALVAIVASAALAPVAAAGGEPKNQPPFTQAVATVVPGARLAAEPKNELPFTRSVAIPETIVVQASNGFSWVDAAIGAAAAIGLGAAGTGAGLAVRASRGTRATTA